MYFLRNDAKDVGSVGVSGLTAGQYSHFLSLKKSSFFPSPLDLVHVGAFEGGHLRDYGTDIEGTHLFLHAHVKAGAPK